VWAVQPPCQRCGGPITKRWRPSETKKYGREGYMYCSRRCSDNRLGLDESVFNGDLSPDAAYWLGFLIGDGNICDNRLTCGLKIDDSEHLRKFAAFFGLTPDRVREYPDIVSAYGMFGKSGFSLRSKPVCDRLQELGISERKSCNEVVLPQFRSNLDVLRGLVDADGSVCFTADSTIAVGLCGSYNVCSFFREVALDLTGSFPKIAPQGLIFTVRLGTWPAKTLAAALYYPGCTALNRKFENARKIAESNQFTGERSGKKQRKAAR